MSELLFISFFNYGAIELAKNHLETLKRNNISNYTAYVTDDESYNELKLDYNVSKYVGDESDYVSKEKKDFGSIEFSKMCYIRYKIINELLKQGKVVWLLDVDTVVFHDLNNYYNSLKKGFDMIFQNDINMLCCGCMLFVPNIKTIQLTAFMYENKNNIYNDQVFINKIFRNNPIFNIGVLNVNQFPNGLLYFNELKPEPHFREAQEKFNNSKEPVYFVHANYMVGIQTKINAFKEKNLWFI